MHRLQHPQGNMTNTFRIPFYAKQRLLMRINGKSCKSIWRVSLCSDLRLRSDELCCLPVSIGEKKSRGEWRFLHFKMLENTEQADRKKKTEKEKNSQYFFGLIQIKLKMTWTPEQPQWSAAGHESKISMTGQSWDVNRRRVPAGKREAAGWTGKANSRRNRHGCTQRGRWWSYRTNERLHGSHEGILNAWQPAKGSNVADEM